MTLRTLALALSGTLVLAALPARAIPAFARKYGTSCTTCHTVYPKLTPFGEAFRRNGFRFPGVDSDYVKQDTVTTKAKTPASAQSWVAAVPPLAFGFNGQALFHPNKDSSGAAADHNAGANLTGLIEEAHLWAGGTFSDTVSYFGEVTLAADGVDVEHAQVYFNDLLGPAHAFNVRVGRGSSNVSSFGPHSSFLADALMPPTSVAVLNGAPEGSGWNVGDHFNGVEVSGVIGGRVDYHVGWNAGTGADVRGAEDVYAHLGFKLGGMALDGEGKSEASPDRPWEETALTFDVFGYHALNGINWGSEEAPNVVLDTINTVGAGLRAQWGSLELNSGFSLENHKRAEPGLSSATYLTQYNELSYIVFPWLVPAVRFEYNVLAPDSDPVTGCHLADGSSCPSVNAWRLWPGVALLPFPNVKVVITALIEGASGAPPKGDWTPAGGAAVPAGPTTSIGPELQNFQVYAAFAF